MRRTSLTHPLAIADISIRPAFGLLGITFCPGKYDEHAQTGFWDRDLSLDLDAIRTWGAEAVVTLVESHELVTLRVENLGEEVRKRGMRWFHLPIVDVSIPDEDFEQQWQTAGNQILDLIGNGKSVLVHCRGGLGRAGTIGARILVEMGFDPSNAMETVRAARHGAIETRAQEKYVLSLKARA